MFAVTEAMLAVASIVQRFQVSAAPTAVVAAFTATTLRPGDVPVTVRSHSPQRLCALAATRSHSGEYRAFVAA